MVHRLRPFVLALIVAGCSCSRTSRRRDPPASEAVASTQAAAADPPPLNVGDVADASEDAGQPTGLPEHKPITWVEPPWPCDANPEIRSRPCSFVPEGTLVRTSGSIARSSTSTSACQRVAVSAGDTLKLVFDQGGAGQNSTGNPIAKSAWQVRCTPGRLEIFWRDAIVPLSYEREEFDIDVPWMEQLDLDSSLGARPLAEMETILQSIRAPEMLHGPEAMARVRLLMIDRALRVHNRDKAELVHKRLGEAAGFNALTVWANAVRERLESFDEEAPIHTGLIQVLGTLPKEPTLPFEEDAPTLFWRAGELCAREESTETPSMRCVSPRRMNWGRSEPYVSPFADGWKMGWETQVVSGGFKTTLVTIAPDGTRGELGQLPMPTLIARGSGKLYAAVSSPDPEANDPVQTLGVDDFDLSASPGSRITALNYYFEKPDRLRSLTKVGSYWNLRPNEPNFGTVPCKSIPLVSPELRWAACVGEAIRSDAGQELPLIAFELVRTPGRRR